LKGVVDSPWGQEYFWVTLMTVVSGFSGFFFVLWIEREGWRIAPAMMFVVATTFTGKTPTSNQK